MTMRWNGFSLTVGALALAGAMSLRAQSGAAAPVELTIAVEDQSGAALSGALVKSPGGKVLGVTDADGRLSVSCIAPCHLRVEAQGFRSKSLQLSAGTTLQLEPAATTEQVTVTAYRAPMGQLESPVTTRVLTETALGSTPAVTLDGQMRQLPGVEMFRRSSSLVANPSSQGMSLRGLGSTSASRTLITEDDVPLNDPMGGWIHWQEQPELAIQNVELARGGISDLYGSSAIGGVVNLVTVRPTTSELELRTSYGAEGTYEDSLLAQTKHGPWGVLGAGGVLGTEGYIQEAPWQRGPVDINSDSHSGNGMVLGEHNKGPLRFFLRGSAFNEARTNGTPYQINGTRLFRYATGGDWQGPHGGSLTLRLYGTDQQFHQTFSSISNAPNASSPNCSYRCGEVPTRYSVVPDNELGADAHWNQPLGAGLLAVAGADIRDVRVWDQEQTYGASPALTNLRDHQRDSAGYAEAMWVHKAWTLTASGRMDWFQNYDGHQLLWSGTSWGLSPMQPVQEGQRVFDPRMGLSRRLFRHWSINASGFRAFRAPTPNELYRSTQVGSALTYPNGSLMSERATGWETGVATEWRWGTIRGSYFLTQVNRPITAVTLSLPTAPPPILLKRENLGQIESRGVSVDFDLAPRRWMTVDGGYQHAEATVTRGTQDVSNWIPEVARNLATLNMRAYRPSIGMLSLQSRLSGRQFDDDANQYMLHGYFRVDAYASHDFGRRLEVFTAGENLLNRQIEVAKTPTTTLAMGRVARAGFLIRLGRAAKSTY